MHYNFDCVHQADLQENGELAKEPSLRKLWHWLGNHRISTIEDSNTNTPAENRHPGVRYVEMLMLS
jgi:hypothetical protein